MGTFQFTSPLWRGCRFFFADLAVLNCGHEQRAHCACSLCWRPEALQGHLPQWHAWLEHLGPWGPAGLSSPSFLQDVVGVESFNHTGNWGAFNVEPEGNKRTWQIFSWWCFLKCEICVYCETTWIKIQIKRLRAKENFVFVNFQSCLSLIHWLW